jgi:hypothetical protein
MIPVPDYAVEEVATHSLALMLASWRRLPAADRLVREGRWAEWETLTPIEPLSEQTLGLVGLGRIGRAVARQAAGLFGGIVAFDPLIGDHFPGVEMVALDELLAFSVGALWVRLVGFARIFLSAEARPTRLGSAASSRRSEPVRDLDGTSCHRGP